MNHGRAAFCVLCTRSEETKITGNLLTKELVTAHHKCLLYSSGIFCTDTPQFDDLFGFSVQDVQKEVKRGAKLHCSRCKKKGATAGCELGRCKKTFHFPCAIEEGAKPFEDDSNGKYGLYCLKHSDPENCSSVNKPKTPRSSKKPSETKSSKTYCLTCEKKEGNISLDSLSNTVVMMYCVKHAPLSLKNQANGDPFTARPSSSCSSDSSSLSLTSSKRPMSFNELEKEDGSYCRKPVKRNRILSNDSSNTDEGGLMPPLESDLEESANSLQGHESALPLLISEDSRNPSASSAGLQVENGYGDLNNNEDETFIHSDAESESLLAPLVIRATFHSSPVPQTMDDERVELVEKEVQTIKREIEECDFEKHEEHVDGPSTPQHSSPAPDLSPERSDPSSPPACTSSSTAPHRPMSRSPPPNLSSPQTPPPTEPSSPQTPPSDPKPDIDSARFWRNCNMAGCTQAVFTEFVTEMNNISSRIQCDQASQEDYDRALSVMMASGTLADIVTKQGEELERRQRELQRASVCLRDVISALKRVQPLVKTTPVPL